MNLDFTSPSQENQPLENSSLGIEKSTPLSNLASAAKLLEGQNTFLRMVASGVSLIPLLEWLILYMERQSPGTHCSVLILDPGANILRFAAAPSMPNEYNNIVRQGIPVGPCHCTCGTAAYRKETVQCENIAEDPLWAVHKDFALSFGLKACTSVPILGSGGRALGTFAFYYREITKPSDYDLALMEVSRDLAAIAIEKSEVEAERIRLFEVEKKAREEAQQLALLNNEFLAVAAHELRTPVAALKMHLQYTFLRFCEDAGSSETTNLGTKRNLEDSIHILRRIQRLSDNLLEASAIRCGAFKLKLKTTCFTALTQKVLKKISHSQGPKFSLLPSSKSLEPLLIDSNRIEAAISSFFEFWNENMNCEETLINLDELNGGVQLKLELSNEIFGKKDFSRIFNRLEGTNPREDVTGLGLELFIASEIIKAHGGRVQVLKSDIGPGTVFTLDLPARNGTLS